SIGITRASLVGLSFGAAVAIDFSLDYPEMVQALVLAAPGLSSDKDVNVQAALAAAEAARKEGLPTIVDAIVNNDAVLASAGDDVRRRVRTMYMDNAHVFASDFALVRLWRPTDPQQPSGCRRFESGRSSSSSIASPRSSASPSTK